MAETAENVAEEYQVSRADQDAFALRSQQRAGNAVAGGYFAEEIVPVEAPGGKAGPTVVNQDEHPRPQTTLEALAKLKPYARNPGTVTAGNASGINDGAAAVILASAQAAERHGLKPRARVLGMASAAVPPRVMGMGPVPATRKLMARLGLQIGDFDVIESNEAACRPGSCLPAPARRCRWRRARQSPWRRIALGHPLDVGCAHCAHGRARLEKRAAPLRSRPCAWASARCFARRSSGSGTPAAREPARADESGYIPFPPNPSKPKYRPPAGAVDAHCHVFGPEAKFPYAPERKYRRATRPEEKLFALRDFLGFDKNVIVQASCHSKDNRAMVDALESSAGRAKGVAFVGEGSATTSSDGSTVPG
jgi:hypothetical protein